MIRTIPLPWTNVYGVARTLAALGTAGTLAFSSARTLFRPVALTGEYPLCEGISAAGVFCLAPDGHTGLTWAKWLCVLLLLAVASGWRPRLTALPHAYISFSVYTGIAIGDGGDQITSVVTLLLVLPALGDGRRWHWQTAGREPDARENAGTAYRGAWALVGVTGLVLLRVQMSFLYFQAAVAKLPHTEWADGTAMWYWGTSLSFGAPPWLEPLMTPILRLPLGVALLTWLPLVVEMSLAVALLLPQRLRWPVMGAGLAFHLSIAVVMGLWSFAFAMAAGIVVLCCPLGGVLRRRVTGPGGRAGGQCAGETEVGVVERQLVKAESVSSSENPSSRASATA
ncbi:hypothetical protein DVK44_24920 [Streptomyces paludis]|uniref:HTTM-like domain-containing protein n=1 Tax=Streptomyces paludis TaxID=2282738 RepID=A0A345I1Q9_9ACTN|nr:hypothetical protein DVK44_24920 [Streptomyces paludis]